MIDALWPAWRVLLCVQGNGDVASVSSDEEALSDSGGDDDVPPPCPPPRTDSLTRSTTDTTDTDTDGSGDDDGQPIDMGNNISHGRFDSTS